MGLDTVELVMWAEKKYEIELHEDQASLVETVEDFTKLIVEMHLLTHPERSLSYDQCFAAVSEELHAGYGVSLAKINDRSRIVKDLGLQ